MTCTDLVTANLRLAHWQARQLHRRYAHVRRLPLEDVEGTAMLGLCRAAQSYDPARGAFSTYAYWVIRQHVMDAARRANVVTLPAQFAGNKREALPAWMVERAEVVEAATVSLSWQRGDRGQPFEVPCPAEDLDAAIDQAAARKVLEGLMRRLPARWRKVVRMCCLEGRPLSEAAAELGVSKSRTQQLRNRAIEEMRRMVRA